MKQVLLIIALLFSYSTINAQELIGTPKSLVLVYNYPENYFYLQLQGLDKRKTENENIFIIDNRLIQVKTLKKSKFIKNTNQELTFSDFVKTYINWEKSYLEETFALNINSKVEFMKSKQGRDFGFWTYDMPIEKPVQVTDSTRTTATQKQIFVLTRIKDYLVGINSPLFEANKFEETRNYLISNIDGIVESRNEINVEELNAQLNK